MNVVKVNQGWDSNFFKIMGRRLSCKKGGLCLIVAKSRMLIIILKVKGHKLSWPILNSVKFSHQYTVTVSDFVRTNRPLQCRY